LFFLSAGGQKEGCGEGYRQGLRVLHKSMILGNLNRNT
jgi:hypothetical protein